MSLGFQNQAIGQQSEPPKFQKPSTYRYLLGVRQERAGNYGQSRLVPSVDSQQASRIRKGQRQHPSPRDRDFVGQIHPVGTGVREMRSPVRPTVEPIDDPFGDFDDQPRMVRLVGRTTVVSSPQEQKSILNRPANSAIAEDNAVQNVQPSIEPLLEPRRVKRQPAMNSSFSRPPTDGGLSQPGQTPQVGLQGESRKSQDLENSEIPDDLVERKPLALDNAAVASRGRKVLSPAVQESFRQQTFELNCEEINGVMLHNSIREIALSMKPNVEPGKSIPQECEFAVYPVKERYWTPQGFSWTASGACSKPLYFQDIQLERYGHTRGPLAQPIISGAHFFGNVIIYPYKAGIHPPNECMYALGYYRPGDCAPWLSEPWPWSARGIAWQALSVVGYSGVIR